MFKWRKRNLNFICKVAAVIIATGSLLLLPISSFAGDLPCDDLDPFSSTPCPLDTWVWVLVLAAAIFGAIQLRRRQKAEASV